MGPIIRRPMQHNRIRPHSNSTHGGQRRRSICHNSRWREDRFGNPTKAKRQCWCGCICGYSPSQTRFCYRGRSGRHGGVQSVVQLCIWSDDQCDWWTQLLERWYCVSFKKEFNLVISANGYVKISGGLPLIITLPCDAGRSAQFVSELTANPESGPSVTLTTS